MSDAAVTVAQTLALYLVIVVSPGPSFAFISRFAASGQRRAAFGATLGLALGATVYAVLTMAGVAILLAQVGWLARALQLAGGAYLVYLGVRGWLEAGRPMQIGSSSDASHFAIGTRQGFLMCLSNPKAIAFFVGLYAAAIPPDTALWAKGAILVGAFVIELGWYSLVVIILSGRWARSFYGRSRTMIERALGTVLAGFGIRLMFDAGLSPVVHE